MTGGARDSFFKLLSNSQPPIKLGGDACLIKLWVLGDDPGAHRRDGEFVEFEAESPFLARGLLPGAGDLLQKKGVFQVSRSRSHGPTPGAVTQMTSGS